MIEYQIRLKEASYYVCKQLMTNADHRKEESFFPATTGSKAGIFHSYSKKIIQNILFNVRILL